MEKRCLFTTGPDGHEMTVTENAALPEGTAMNASIATEAGNPRTGATMIAGGAGITPTRRATSSALGPDSEAARTTGVVTDATGTTGPSGADAMRTGNTVAAGIAGATVAPTAAMTATSRANGGAVKTAPHARPAPRPRRNRM